MVNNIFLSINNQTQVGTKSLHKSNAFSYELPNLQLLSYNRK